MVITSQIKITTKFLITIRDREKTISRIIPISNSIKKIIRGLAEGEALCDRIFDICDRELLGNLTISLITIKLQLCCY